MLCDDKGLSGDMTHSFCLSFTQFSIMGRSSLLRRGPGIEWQEDYTSGSGPSAELGMGKGQDQVGVQKHCGSGVRGVNSQGSPLLPNRVLGKGAGG